jgi:hypothetical protein
MGRVQTGFWTGRAGDGDDGDGEFFIWGACKLGFGRGERVTVTMVTVNFSYGARDIGSQDKVGAEPAGAKTLADCWGWRLSST